MGENIFVKYVGRYGRIPWTCFCDAYILVDMENSMCRISALRYTTTKLPRISLWQLAHINYKYPIYLFQCLLFLFSLPQLYPGLYFKE
jgi:hypothetical protein